jgi:predicted ATPase
VRRVQGRQRSFRQLELDRFSVVKEAGTDAIAAAQANGTIQPWMDHSFIDVV